jgi:hypothetical protein
MAPPYEIDPTCPVCGGAMLVTRVGCADCGSALEGAFRLRGAPAGRRAPGGPASGPRPDDEPRFGRLVRLDPAQLDFVEAFLRCRGVIKNVEDMLGISYPTVKARLAEVLGAMGFGPEEDPPDGDRRREQREILDALRQGRITTDEAHRLLQRNQAATAAEAAAAGGDEGPGDAE